MFLNFFLFLGVFEIFEIFCACLRIIFGEGWNHCKNMFESPELPKSNICNIKMDICFLTTYVRAGWKEIVRNNQAYTGHLTVHFGGLLFGRKAFLRNFFVFSVEKNLKCSSGAQNFKVSFSERHIYR